jgi:hypothetical protein
MTLGFTQPLTEMSTRNLPGGKGYGNHTAICEPDCLANVGASTSHNPTGLNGLLQGELYLLLLKKQMKSIDIMFRRGGNYVFLTLQHRGLSCCAVYRHLVRKAHFWELCYSANYVLVYRGSSPAKIHFTRDVLMLATFKTKFNLKSLSVLVDETSKRIEGDAEIFPLFLTRFMQKRDVPLCRICLFVRFCA